MKKLLLIISIVLITNFSFAQLSVGGSPKTFIHKDLAVLLTSVIDIPQPNLSSTIDYDNNPENFYKTRRFGVVIPVGINFFEKADYSEIDNGKLWVLRLKSENAQALNIYSDNFYIPVGGELFIYNKDQSQIIGAFTSINNIDSNTFATELVYGDEMVIEYFQPNEVIGIPVFQISEIGYAYRDCAYDITKTSNEFGSSGSCNVNVNCPEGNDYRNAQRGIVRILIRMDQYYMGWCTGSLINNTARDLAPYVISAAHCIEDGSPSYYSTYIFYFNYESSGCSSASTEPSPSTLTGTTVQSQGESSDFVLFRLINNVPQSYNAYWNAWDVSTTASQSGVSIHHPSGDIKKISTYTSPLVGISFTSNQNNTTHWKVQWVQTQTNYGITEGGSSGSPIFNSNSKIVGTLTGGTSSCDASISDKVDYYGKMSYSWTSNGTSSQYQLKPWLDPQNTGLTQFRGDDYTTYLTSIDDVNQTKEIYSRIYPNPAKNDINIILTPQLNPIQVKLYDESLKLILSQTIPANTSEYSINAQNINPGYYIVKFNSIDKTWTDKLIISQ
ncbi:MAG: T9SS type A sorting domain-containing protein [Bacteroidales bacterium]|nr:T9SS type A sorting domain-containing protein [Bacteroidales bacterium]